MLFLNKQTTNTIIFDFLITKQNEQKKQRKKHSIFFKQTNKQKNRINEAEKKHRNTNQRQRQGQNQTQMQNISKPKRKSDAKAKANEKRQSKTQRATQDQ